MLTERSFRRLLGNTSETDKSTENSSMEDVLKKAEDYIRNATLASPRFQAFADYADLLSLSSPERKRFTANERALVIETIRQRVNGVIGYKKELHEVSNLLDKYLNNMNTTHSAINQRDTQIEYADRLVNLKNNEIEKKSQTRPPGTPASLMPEHIASTTPFAGGSPINLPFRK